MNVNPKLVLVAAGLCIGAQARVRAHGFERRGLLDDTLVIVSSNFGRTRVLNPGSFGSAHDGRDRNIHGFTVLLASGGDLPLTQVTGRVVKDIIAGVRA